MCRNIQLLNKRVFRWVMAIAWKTLSEQRVHIAGSTLALRDSSFPLVPMRPPQDVSGDPHTHFHAAHYRLWLL
jgi:hypothetical protein